MTVHWGIIPIYLVGCIPKEIFFIGLLLVKLFALVLKCLDRQN